MAYADDITLKDSAAASKTFSRQLSEPNRCTWIDTSITDPTTPRTMRISHRKEALKAYPGEYQDRHTIEFVTIKKDAAGRPYSQIATFSVQYPLTGPLVRADLDHELAFLKDATNGMLVVTAHIDKLLRSEL